MSKSPEHPSDICTCGDFRCQHKPWCFCGCVKFKNFSKASPQDLEIWRKYYKAIAETKREQACEGDF